MQNYPALTLDIMELVGNKWTLLVVHTLGQEAVRFSELRRRTAPISQKMLTQTLRALERHGMVQRTVLPTMPPQVEYALTAVGRSFLSAASVICSWTRDNVDALTSARKAFDRAAEKKAAR
jgi:DNA-binding HxlR family transcriptional regulator